MLVSIIVPVYNVEKYLEKCLDSLENQTYARLEIILVDDGSTDISGDICDSYAQKYENIKVYHKQNGGVSSARNLGLDMMSDDGYVMFVDPDDYVECDFVDAMIKEIIDVNNGLIVCKWININEFGEVKSNLTKSEKKTYTDQEKFLSVLNENDVCGFVWNKIFSKKIIKEQQLRFDESVKLAEDLWFCIQYLSFVDCVVALEKSLYYYVHHSNSVCWNTQFNASLFDSQLYALKLIVDYISVDYSKAKELARENLLSQSVYYWVRMYKSKIFQKPTEQKRMELKTLKKNTKIASFKYKVYYYFVMYMPQILYFGISLGINIRNKIGK
ncbi:uncharacterized protein BN724_01770 [Clostridium sp. CAG:590]|nr:uncharacterized protein BN724_01770 [Clostridium sp. CAG:590]